jgi:uncharacterized membrane protein YecN with MAPEG domain
LKKTNKEERKSCLEQLQREAETILKPYSNEEWAQTKINNIKDEVRGITQNPFMEQLGRAIDSVGGFASSAGISLIFSIVNAISGAMAWIIEILGVLIAMVGPLAIAVSLFPWTGDVWLVWLKMFIGVNLVSLFYKLCVGIVSTQVLFSEGPTELIGPVALSILSIFIVGSLASGSASGAFSTSAQHGGIASRLAGSTATSAVGGVATGVTSAGGAAIKHISSSET